MSERHFFDPRSQHHGLPHDPIKSCVIPRPIGWISTRSPRGQDNLAPYSFFNLIADSPYMCCFASSGEKDSLRNAEASGEFVFNLATESLIDAMNRSSASVGPDIDEFALAGLTKLASVNVAPPRVAESPIHLECAVDQIVELPSRSGQRNALVTGLIVGVHIDRSVLTDGLIDVARLRPISRLGYMQYATIGEDLFTLQRPRSIDDRPQRARLG